MSYILIYAKGPWKKRACRGPATITRLPSLFIYQFFHNIKLLQPYDVCRHQPEPLSANIEGLTAAKASILSEMCKRECCHCLCLQERHRSTNLPRPKIAGMSLVVERPHSKYGSAMLLLFATARSVVKSVKVPVVEVV